ncbi:sugar phosphate isomerase/epimerase family protein [Mycolicibacterium sp. XJ1819]
MTTSPVNVMWGACLHNHDLLTRAECLRPAGFDSMTAFVSDVEELEARLGSTRAIRDALAERDAPVICLDLYIGWYPGYDPGCAAGAAADLLKTSEQDILRYAGELGVEFISLVAPFQGADAPFEAVVDSLGQFTDRANALGVRPHLEVSNGSKVSTIAGGLALVEAVGREGLGLVIDTYNLIKSGGRPVDVDPVPLERIFQVQLVDGSFATQVDRFYDSTHFRELPGEGELPVADIVQRILDKGPLPPTGPEIFNDRLVEMPPLAAAQACSQAMMRLLDRLSAD